MATYRDHHRPHSNERTTFTTWLSARAATTSVEGGRYDGAGASQYMLTLRTAIHAEGYSDSRITLSAPTIDEIIELGRSITRVIGEMVADTYVPDGLTIDAPEGPAMPDSLAAYLKSTGRDQNLWVAVDGAPRVGDLWVDDIDGDIGEVTSGQVSTLGDYPVVYVWDADAGEPFSMEITNWFPEGNVWREVAARPTVADLERRAAEGDDDAADCLDAIGRESR